MHEIPLFPTLTALNLWLEARCVALWSSIKHPEQSTRTVADMRADEHPLLMQLPVPSDAFIEQTKRVSPTCLVAFESHHSVLPSCPIGR